MKRSVLIMLLIICSAVSIYPESVKVAVLEFENKTDINRFFDFDFGNYAADMIEESITDQVRYCQIITRRELYDIIWEQDLGLSGYISEESAVQIGNIAGAHYLVLGSVESLYYKADRDLDYMKYTCVSVIRVKIIDAETGRIITTKEIKSESPHFWVHSWNTAMFTAYNWLEKYKEAVRAARYKSHYIMRDLQCSIYKKLDLNINCPTYP